jgi:hypothetical protein
MSGQAGAERAHQRVSYACHEKAPYKLLPTVCGTPREPAIYICTVSRPLLPTPWLAEWFPDKRTPASGVPRGEAFRTTKRAPGELLRAPFACPAEAIRRGLTRLKPKPAEWFQTKGRPPYSQVPATAARPCLVATPCNHRRGSRVDSLRGAAA